MRKIARRAEEVRLDEERSGELTMLVLEMKARRSDATTLKNIAQRLTTFCSSLRLSQRMGNLTSALEFMDGGVLDLVRDNLSVSAGWATGSPYYVLVETMGFDLANDRLAVEKFLEGLMEEGLVEDGVMAKGEDEIAEIWGVRESCGVAVNRMGGR